MIAGNALSLGSESSCICIRAVPHSCNIKRRLGTWFVLFPFFFQTRHEAPLLTSGTSSFRVLLTHRPKSKIPACPFRARRCERWKNVIMYRRRILRMRTRSMHRWTIRASKPSRARPRSLPRHIILYSTPDRTTPSTRDTVARTPYLPPLRTVQLRAFIHSTDRSFVHSQDVSRSAALDTLWSRN